MNYRRCLELCFMLSTLVARPVSCFFTNPPTIQRSSSSLLVRTTTTLAMTKKVLVPIAHGSEEIETSCIQDTLVRFGADVTVASVNPNGELLCKMSRGLLVQAHTSIAEAAKEAPYDLIVLPGGMPGAEHLRDSIELQSLLKQQVTDGRMYGAVCAAPAIVLASQGLIPFDDADCNVTCFPVAKFRDLLQKAASDDRVVVHNNMITSQGPGTSLEFALALGEKLFGKEKRDEIAKQLLVKE
mmetsp:Transcript_5544/g.10797  ORF Transcript_5544/g.10797 Transcript_5544/m.10797 type:complete len:241 (-) Transcript_5544:179-901(-)